MRSSPRHLLAALVVLVGAALAPPAAAQSFRLSSSTHVHGLVRPGAAGASNQLPFFELITLSTRDLGLQGLSLNASLWGMVEALDVAPSEDRVSGDVSTLQLTYRAPAKSMLDGLTVRGGRQFISAGPTILEQIDGGLVSYRAAFGLDLTLFGGAPTGLRFIRQEWPLGDDDSRYTDNWVVGGRLGYRLMDLLVLGASYRQQRYYNEVANDEVGWDLVMTPLDALEVVHHGAVELTSQRIKEVNTALLLHLSRKLSTRAGFRFISPDLFIPRTSIFAVFADETHSEGYLGADWRLRRWIGLEAELGVSIYGESCVDEALGGCTAAEAALNADLRANLRLGPARRYRVTVEAERTGTIDGGLTRLRIAGSAPLLARMTAIADLDFFVLDAPGEESGATLAARSRVSFAGSAYLSYVFRDDLQLLAGGRAMVTPLFSRAGAFMVRLNWILDRPADGAAVKVRRSSTASATLSGGAL